MPANNNSSLVYVGGTATGIGAGTSANTVSHTFASDMFGGGVSASWVTAQGPNGTPVLAAANTYGGATGTIVSTQTGSFGNTMHGPSDTVGYAASMTFVGATNFGVSPAFSVYDPAGHYAGFGGIA